MRLLAVCVGAVAPLRVRGPRGVPTEVASGIVKTAVSTLERPEPVSVSALGLAGDEQADPSVHGGLDKAVYLYPREHYPVWCTLRAPALLQVQRPDGIRARQQDDGAKRLHRLLLQRRSSGQTHRR